MTEIRPVTTDELGDFYAVFSRTMGFPPPSERDVERSQRNRKPERSLAAFDRGQIVGTAYAHLFDLTLPGLSTLAAAGVTAVAVATTHRRRGILTELMRRQLLEAKERGEPLAILIASESVIYGRFGYGLSTTIVDIEVDTRYEAFAGTIGTSGRVSFVDADEAGKVFPGVYDRWRRTQPGAITRDEVWWEDWREQRKPGNEKLVTWEDDDGNVQAFALYSTHMKWEAGLAQYPLDIAELTSVSTEGAAALWRHCLSADLVRKVSAPTRSIDDPLRWMLANPRSMQVTRMGDFLWTRILDVEAALTSRGYDADVDLVLAVSDDMFEENTGRYALSASSNGPSGASGASCQRTERVADITLPISELGAIYLGGVRPSQLADVGRIIENTPGALRRADAAFASHPRPWGNTYF